MSNRESVYSAPAGLSVHPAGLSALRAEGRLAAAFLLLAGMVVGGAIRQTGPDSGHNPCLEALEGGGHKTSLYPCVKAVCVIMRRHKPVRSRSEACVTHRNIQGPTAPEGHFCEHRRNLVPTARAGTRTASPCP